VDPQDLLDTLESRISRWLAGEHDEALATAIYDDIEHYRGWRDKGGFEPVGGDVRYARLRETFTSDITAPEGGW
jgi:hypothetical protein